MMTANFFSISRFKQTRVTTEKVVDERVVHRQRAFRFVATVEKPAAVRIGAKIIVARQHHVFNAKVPCGVMVPDTIKPRVVWSGFLNVSA